MARREKGDGVPQKYRSKESGEEVRIERRNSNTLTAHYEAGAERITEKELREHFTFLGPWETADDAEKNLNRNGIP